MNEFEAVADVATGGVLGRAVEPKAGESDGRTHEANCLNCGAALLGPYCYECGQHAHVHRTLGAFFHDFAHGVLHFEGKIWRTLPLLVWKPGELTRRYIDGQRASFVSPIALFLFCVFFMFAVVGMTGTSVVNTVNTKRAENAKQAAADGQSIARLQQKRASLAAAGLPTTDIDDQLKDLNDEVAALRMTIGGPPATSKDIHLAIGNGLPKWVNKVALKAKENPELLYFKLKTNAYKYSWALIPISVPFVWLLFPFSRRFKLYDHTVFVTYSLCFMMLLLTLGTVASKVVDQAGNIVALVPPVHMYRQLRGAYGVSVVGALWRAFLLILFAFLAIALFAAVLVTLGLLD